ncbi:patatin-like phospholipase [Arcicella aurantiaca]|uniref:Patatin-like phospholipase n=1 Tax=Arcicella aurantiaca TaxID=591202 RepID=A0A316E9U6_9BACT|nr:patatin-like phospholipase family protein [Arcicella aurantiaca]PWK27157.1 patatin-like phospholipase [Arcicella aurantiaca]
MRKGLVLSGGGARGLFAVQILKRMRDYGFDFKTIKFISGVSVGSIIGAMIAQGDIDTIIKVFPTLRNNDVYKGKISTFNIVKNRILGKNYVLDIEPLHALLSKYISLQKAKDKGIVFHIGFVDMNSGKYRTCTQYDFDTDENYIRAIMASCSQPVIWKPQRFSTHFEEFTNASDGGIITVSPIKSVLQHRPDQVIIINSSPVNPTVHKGDFTMEQMLLRTIDLAVGESFAKDMERFKEINKDPFRFVPSVIYQTDLDEDSLNFEDENLRKLRIDNANQMFFNPLTPKQ